MMTPSQRRWYGSPKYKKCYRRWYLKAKVKDKAEILAILGDKCVRCGYDDPRALCVDHINDDGVGDVSCDSGIRNRLLAVKRNPGRYQTLCANCNLIKEIMRREIKR